jgi:hypothetical protein
MYPWLLAAHIAVLGYWLGSELVINSQYRFVTHRSDLPFAARDAVMDHLMDVDQHVRYALILQLMLGVMLMASNGMLGPGWFWTALAGGAAWLILVEIVHRRRKSRRGAVLARADRWLRYGVMAALVATAAVAGDLWPLWLRLKLLLFVGIMACGVGIRLALIRHFALWAELAAGRGDDVVGGTIRQTYWRATGILMLLWALIAMITVLAIARP